ncbi:MAG: hypothetical protein IIZ34_04380 [Eubacterium sp.]|nr:hypothetical protein [Eubacterium sp.]
MKSHSTDVAIGPDKPMTLGVFIQSLERHELNLVLEILFHHATKNPVPVTDLLPNIVKSDILDDLRHDFICSSVSTISNDALLVWSEAPLDVYLSEASSEDIVYVLPCTTDGKTADAFGEAAAHAFLRIIEQRNKEYRELSARGRRAYDALRQLYPDLPVAVLEMGGPVIYTLLRDYDFEICGGFYRRPITIFPWRIDENETPMQTVEIINVPSSDPVRVAHKIYNTVEKYRALEKEADET